MGAVGDRKDKLINKACAHWALQPPALTNWNKWNKVKEAPSGPLSDMKERPLVAAPNG